MMKRTGKGKGLVGFGSCLVDTLIHVDNTLIDCHFPGARGGRQAISAEQMRLLTQLTANLPLAKCAGGAAANTIRAFARLGGHAAFLGQIGDDTWGKCFVDSMSSSGVDTRGIHSFPGTMTGRCMSLITPDADRTLFAYFGAEDHLDESLFEEEMARQYSHLYIEGFQISHFQMLEKLLITAKNRDTCVCFDLAAREVVASYSNILPDLLKRYVTIAFANAQEAEALFHVKNPEKAAGLLAELCPVAVVKDGERGAYISGMDGKVRHIAAWKVKAVDTTGAGDFWAAGFLYGYLNGSSLEEAGALGTEVAAQVVQVVGTELEDRIWNSFSI